MYCTCRILNRILEDLKIDINRTFCSMTLLAYMYYVTCKVSAHITVFTVLTVGLKRLTYIWENMAC